MNITVERAFKKHRVLGDIYAIEILIDEGFARTAVAAMRCTRPEQLTRGALPVLSLAGGESLQYYLNNQSDFATWEPPMVDTEALEAIVAAERYCQETQAEWERHHKSAAAAKKTHDKACDDLRRIVREASTEPEPLPLLDVLDAEDAAKETTDGNDDGSTPGFDAGSDVH